MITKSRKKLHIVCIAVCLIVLIAAVWLLFTNDGEKPVRDLKNNKFDGYDHPC